MGAGLSSINNGYFAGVNAATYPLMDPVAGAEEATPGAKRDAGLLRTYGQGDAGGNNVLVYDQGIDSDASLNWLGNTQPDLVEQQYIIEMDSRLLQVITPAGGQTASPSFVDDDSIASYFFSLSNTPDYFGAQANGPNVSNGALAGITHCRSMITMGLTPSTQEKVLEQPILLDCWALASCLV